MKFKESSLRATSVGTNKSALAVVARPDRTPNCRRYASAFTLTDIARTRTLHLREFPPLEMFKQQGQRAV